MSYLITNPSGHCDDPFVDEIPLDKGEEQHASLVRVHHNRIVVVDTPIEFPLREELFCFGAIAGKRDRRVADELI